MEERKVFKIKDTDKRKELIETVEEGKDKFVSQKRTGKDVSFFSPETGFVLLDKQAKLNLDTRIMRRVFSCAKLSLGEPLELREFYYTLRGKPDLVKPFTNVKAENIYNTVLSSINDLEIVCDLDRSKFTVGGLPKGFLFDEHSWSYADREKKVGFTEKIARDIWDWEVETTQNIIVVEKNSSATRLVDLGFSGLANSMIVTVGGNFNRAIWVLTDAMKNKKNILFITDADAFGVDMLRQMEFGTENSRHLPYKFPPGKYNNIYYTGLYPSIGEKIGLPNDVESKRPLENKWVKRRIGFLKKYGLIDDRDLDTWERNKTYELEALSTNFQNDKGEPIGLAIYLVEYMRAFDIPIKPPLPPDDELEKEFEEAAKKEFKHEIEEDVTLSDPVQILQAVISRIIERLGKEIIEEVYEDYLPDLDEVLEEVTAKEIKYHIREQYKENPDRREYDLREIAKKLKPTFNVDVDWDAEELKKKVENIVQEYVDGLREEGDLYEEDIEFTPIHNDSSHSNIYDLALEKLGANREDVSKIRDAIKWRFKEEIKERVGRGGEEFGV